MKLRDRMPVKSLRTELRNLAYIQKMRKLNTISGGAGLTLSAISFIMVIFVIITLVVFCKVAKKKDNENPAEDQTPTYRALTRFSQALNTLTRNDNPHEQLQRASLAETVASSISAAQQELNQSQAEQLIPRSSTIRKPSIAPRNVNLTEKHTSTLMGSQALQDAEALQILVPEGLASFKPATRASNP